jgi:Tol biopolymer transport system component
MAAIAAATGATGLASPAMATPSLAPPPLATATTERISSALTGGPPAERSFFPRVSATGRYVTFSSAAPDIVRGDTNNTGDLFLRDRRTGRTERVSVSSKEKQGNSYSRGSGAPSPDGRYVAFESDASNLVRGDTNGQQDIFVRDRRSGTTRRVSLGPNGVQANGPSFDAKITADGRYVTFTSVATNLVPGDTNNDRDVFVRDLKAGRTWLASSTSDGRPANRTSESGVTSPDGRFVYFASNADNLEEGAPFTTSVYRKDLRTGAVRRVSTSETGGLLLFGRLPSLSGDGNLLAYSGAPTLGGFDQAYVKDLRTDKVVVASIGVDGQPANHYISNPTISASGRYVAFDTSATNMHPTWTPPGSVVVRDLRAATTTIGSVSTTGQPVDNGHQPVPVVSDGGVAFMSASPTIVPDAQPGGINQVYFRTFG